MDKANAKLLFFGGEVMNSKRQEKGKLSQVIQIHVCCLP